MESSRRTHGKKVYKDKKDKEWNLEEKERDRRDQRDQRDQRDEQENCRCEPENRSFCVPLSFDQVLKLNESGQLVPLSTLAVNPDEVHGTFKIKFNETLSKTAYELYVYNGVSPTDRISSSTLNVAPASNNGPVVVPLYDGPARNVNGLFVKGSIDNRSINKGVTGTVITVNSVSSLYEAIRQSAVYVNVTSDKFPQGIIRGQIYSSKK